MKKNNMYFDTHRAKVYRANYRPSFGISQLFKTILTVLLEGQSPVGGSPFHYARKRK